MSTDTTRAGNVKGSGLMVLSALAYTLNDTAIKLIGETMTLGQMLFLRGIVMTLMMLATTRWIGRIRLDLPARDWGLILLRSFADLAATFFFITALLNMPIANITAILQALPLTVALAAALFLGEPLGWRRLAAILIGFAGVMLIVRPGAEGFDIWSLWALGAVGFITLRDLATRPLSAATPSATVAFAGTVVVMLGGGVALLFEPWVALDARGLGLIGLTALFMTVAFLTSVATMRFGEIGVVSQFRYTGLVWALLFGLAVFGDWPDNLTLLGAAIVVATGLFTLHRERRLAAKAAAAAGQGAR